MNEDMNKHIKEPFLEFPMVDFIPQHQFFFSNGATHSTQATDQCRALLFLGIFLNLFFPEALP